MADTPEETEGTEPESVADPTEDATSAADESSGTSESTDATAEAADEPEASAADDAADTPPADEATAPAVEEPVPAGAETAVAGTAVAAAADTPATDGDSSEADSTETDGPQLDIGSDAPAEPTVDPNWRPVIRGKIDRFGVAMGTGRRKTSVARVRIKPGDGKIQINGRDLDEYISVERDREMVLAPLEATEQKGKVDVWVRVKGGGTTGQTGAIVLGIARALQGMQPELHHTLSEAGFLTRDGRMVERKKYGLRKARRSFQFSKR